MTGLSDHAVKRRFSIACGLVFATLWTLGADASGHAVSGDYATLRGPTMGTIYTVKYRPIGPTTAPDRVRAVIESLLERIDAEFSTYRPDSEIAAFNRAPAQIWVPVSRDVIVVARKAVELSRQSNGAFDMTLEPVLDLWGFAAGTAPTHIPQSAALRTVMALVDYRAIDVREQPPALRKKRNGMRVNFNALVAGFAADQSAVLLRGMGISDFLVDMGGEMRLAGNSPRGGRWRVGIEYPAPGPRRIERSLELTDTGISTSGDYRNYFVYQGKRYSHEFDARTGWPIRQSVTSVSVVSPRAIDADGYATALLALGPVAGPVLARRLGLAALFIVSDGQGGWRERPTPAFIRLEAEP